MCARNFRQRNLEVLAVGVIPLGIATADLSGVRLAAGEHLPGLLESMVSASLSGQGVSDSAQAGPVETAELSSMSRWVGRTPSEEPEGPKTKTPIPVRSGQDQTRVDRPNDLLTREELTALLEDE